MTEPALDALPDDLADLLDAERSRPDGDVPTGAEARDRVRSRLAATLGPLALGGGPGPTVPPPVAPIDASAATTALGAGLASLLGKPVAIGLLALGIVGSAGWYALRPDATAPSATPHAAVPRDAVPVAPVANTSAAPRSEPTDEAAPISVPALVAPDARPVASAVPALPERDTDLAAERRLLEGARQAVLRGDANGALASLQQHAQEFPRGRLVEEREVLWMRALVVAGRRGEAMERASRYKKTHPRSLLLPSLEQMLGPIP